MEGITGLAVIKLCKGLDLFAFAACLGFHKVSFLLQVTLLYHSAREKCQLIHAASILFRIQIPLTVRISGGGADCELSYQSFILRRQVEHIGCLLARAILP